MVTTFWPSNGKTPGRAGAEPAATIGRVLEFLGVDADDEQIATCAEAGDFKRLSGGREAGREDRTSFYRKGKVGDWREHFDATAERRFEKKGGRLLAELGYATAAATA